MLDLKEIMKKKHFAVVGDTLNPEKYAYKIKEAMLAKGYSVYAVGKELSSLNDIEGELEIIDLCINPKRGLELMKECTKPFEAIVIQPGAESDELKAYLDEKNYPYMEGCLLVGLSLYA